MSHKIIKNVTDQNLGQPHLHIISTVREAFNLVKNTYFDIEDLGGGGFYYFSPGYYKSNRLESEIFSILEKDSPNNIITKLMIRYGFSITYNGMDKTYIVKIYDLGINSGYFADLKEAIRNFRFQMYLMLESTSNNLSEVS